MRKEFLLLVFSSLLTLALGIGLIRWLAPGLLGVPADLQLVQSDQRVPPFYQNVFRVQDLNSRDFILKDPHVKRAKPLVADLGVMGPNDLLGFRNRAIAVRPKIITIGDSQTYGNNAALEQNWPSVLARRLGLPPAAVYNMSTGGWSALDYLYIADKARALQPKTLIIAFYAGNDPLEAFMQAYGNPIWADYRVDPDLNPGDAPKVNFPAPPNEIWQATLADDSSMALTPALRHANSMSHPAVDAGWEIMVRAAERLATLYEQSDTDLMITLIPTKEYAMSNALATDGMMPPSEYLALVQDEAARIQAFAERLSRLRYGRYVDVTTALLANARMATNLYAKDSDGHPLAAGYQAIGDAVAAHCAEDRLTIAPGLYGVGTSPTELYQIRLVTEQGWWLVTGAEAGLPKDWLSHQLSLSANASTHTADNKLGQLKFARDGEFSFLTFLGTITAEGKRHPIDQEPSDGQRALNEIGRQQIACCGRAAS